MTDGRLYERDFVRWSEEQAEGLRVAAASRTDLPLDWDHLAEEIDALGKSVRSELRNRLATIIEHLFKLDLSCAADPRAGWMSTVHRERIEVEALLDENPSLRATLADSLDSADAQARRLVQVSLAEIGEWTPGVQRRLGGMRHGERDVIDPAAGLHAPTLGSVIET